MAIIRLEAESTSTVGSVSDSQRYVGHFTASVADTTAGQTFDGVFALDEYIDGDWVESDEFNSSGVYPGFNAISGLYRLRLKTAPGTGKTGKAVVNGTDLTSEVPY